MSRRRIVAVATGLALALPAGALAQGAGDQQYSDPFVDQPKGQGGGDRDTAASQPVTTPTEGATAGSTGAGELEGASAGSTGAGELPRSGFNAGIVAALGAAMLLVGSSLRGLLLLPSELPPSYLMGGSTDRRRHRRSRR